MRKKRFSLDDGVPKTFGRRKVISLILLVAVGIFVAATGPKLVDTVDKGTYQIKQAAVTGTMSAKMTPGLWLQLFGDIEEWPKADTFFFTADKYEGKVHDQSIEVRFNDGSLCNVSGTLRVILPATDDEAIALVTILGYKDYHELEQKLILPITRNALRLTANLMTARESYSEKRHDFIFLAWDQIQNGIYETEETEIITTDPITEKKVHKTVKIIKKDADGNKVRQVNPWAGTGINLKNFEIKDFVYAEKVRKQIETQQEALMAVATARANSEKAIQDTKTIEEQGKAKVMGARYEKEQEKIRAVVDAEKVKEVAELQAQQRLEVAKLDKQAASETRQQQILLGEGEAKRKALVLQADGALQQKLKAYVEAQGLWADAFARRNVPAVYTAGSGTEGGGNADTEFKKFMMLQNMRNIEELGIDMRIKQGTTTSN
jgi:regulator of protease activity HflC (stomatin/prohibitin superfamily)